VEKLVKNTGMIVEKWTMLQHLCKIMIGRDERILSLAVKNLSLEDFINLKDRLIGTGYIGGKAVGMILARKILSNDSTMDWDRLLEPHDSFYIGSDVYYTYIVQNGWWRLLMEHKTDEGYYSAASELHERMLAGHFHDEIKEKFQQIIEYFGQSPFIVRSSSLLEDAFGNAFAGKYESYFLVNQGSPARRYEQFEDAVHKIFASTMNEDALAYRAQRGLDKLDEQMALLVQRVSGSYNNQYFFPDVAGVGLSYNTYVWKNTIDPKAGMLRIVFGLGTRAVNRVEGDYPRIVSLDEPLLKPQSGLADERKYSQHEVDLLNITDNALQTISLSGLVSENPDLKIDLIGVRDAEMEERLRAGGSMHGEAWILNFDRLFTSTRFAADMKRILQTLETAYNYPVDIEFTANFTGDGQYRINVLQCRPQQTRWLEKKVEIPDIIDNENAVFISNGNFLGDSGNRKIRRIIYVDPRGYGELPMTGKYDVARLVGRINRQIKNLGDVSTLLLGPGRWGTTTPSLGVPVRFSEINNVSVLVEIAYMRDDLIPELSYGTHFFQDLVETNIFYVALFPEKSGVLFNMDLLLSRPNMLNIVLSEENKYGNIVRVCDFEPPLSFMADIMSQKVACYTSN
jgi:hypothetical protein